MSPQKEGISRADLDGVSMRAQQPALPEIKRVLFIARRMLGRRVECIETVPLGLNVRPVCKGETHSAEDRNCAIEVQVCAGDGGDFAEDQPNEAPPAP